MNDVLAISNMDGRLGNILFKSAVLYSYVKKTGKSPRAFVCDKYWKKYYDSYNYFHLFPVIPALPQNTTTILEDKYHHTTSIPDCPLCNVYLNGYWESEDYFMDVNISEMFPLTDELKSTIISKHPNIEECVGISIRRGDYLNFRNLFMIPKITWYEYVYHKYFDGKQVMVFSDDIDYCERCLSHNKNFMFYRQTSLNNDRYLITTPEENIFTFAMCKHHICSDSTWSWWGARLLERKDSVNIFQDKRFTKQSNLFDGNYIPERWIKEETIYEN